MSLMRRLFIITGMLVGLVFVQACGKLDRAEPDCNFVKNSANQRVSWKTTVPITLYFDSSVPTSYYDAVRAAVAKWNQVGRQINGYDYFILSNTTGGWHTPARDGYSKIYLMENWDSRKPREQARTTIYWTGSRIYEADIRLNDAFFNFAVGPDADAGTVHLESLLVHELGHVLGLAHVEDDHTSVMQPELASGVVRDEVSQGDLQSMMCEYALGS